MRITTLGFDNVAAGIRYRDIALSLAGFIDAPHAAYIPESMAALFPTPPEGGYWAPDGDPTGASVVGGDGSPAPHLVPNPGEIAVIATEWATLPGPFNYWMESRWDLSFGNQCTSPQSPACRFRFEADNNGTPGTRQRVVNNPFGQTTSCQNTDTQSGVIGFQNPNNCAGVGSQVNLPACGGLLFVWVTHVFTGGLSTTGGAPQRWRFVIEAEMPISLGNILLNVHV